MSDLATWPDIEEGLIALFSDIATTANFVVPEPTVPLLYVVRITGGNDRFTDYPLVQVDSIAGSRETARSNAALVRQRMLSAPHTVTVDGQPATIDRVTCSSGPNRAPWGDSRFTTYTASYTARIRR